MTELAKLVALADRVDVALAKGSLENRHGRARTLLEHRRRLSNSIESWCSALGLTPSARAGWVRTLQYGTIGDEIRRRLEALEADGG